MFSSSCSAKHRAPLENGGGFVVGFRPNLLATCGVLHCFCVPKGEKRQRLQAGPAKSPAIHQNCHAPLTFRS